MRPMTATNPLRRYTCHKEVEAAQIVWIEREVDSNGSADLVFESVERQSIRVDLAYMRKHQPQIGGYYVRYDGGYESFSPADAFEAGYAPGQGIRATAAMQATAIRHLVNEAEANQTPEANLFARLVAVADALDDVAIPPVKVITHG